LPVPPFRQSGCIDEGLHRSNVFVGRNEPIRERHQAESKIWFERLRIAFSQLSADGDGALDRGQGLVLPLGHTYTPRPSTDEFPALPQSLR
jgi:hypothetical protein